MEFSPFQRFLMEQAKRAGYSGPEIARELPRLQQIAKATAETVRFRCGDVPEYLAWVTDCNRDQQMAWVLARDEILKIELFPEEDLSVVPNPIPD